METDHLVVTNAQRLRPVLVAVAVACLILTAREAVLISSAAANSNTTEETVVSPTGENYQTTLDNLNNITREYRVRVEEAPESWLKLEWLANAYLERAQLTGQFEHYAEADAAMHQVGQVAQTMKVGALSRAELNYTLHRLVEVEPDLQRAESALLVSNSTQRRIDAIRADVALQQGRYDDAFAAYSTLDEQAPSTESALRLAFYHLQVGDESSFDKWMATAEDRVLGKSPRLRAWLKLHLGIADLGFGRYDEALAHYNEALVLFPDYWLVEEHIAEIDVIQGRLKLAETKYRDLIKRTDSPMFRVALAEVLTLKTSEDPSSIEGAADEAAQLTKTAMDQFATMYERIPESMAGHALEVSLQLDDPDNALALAEHNYQIRPNGESAVLLAQAHMVSGDYDTAINVLQTALASDYQSPKLFATTSIAFNAHGQKELAKDFADRAKALKHDAMDDVSWLSTR